MVFSNLMVIIILKPLHTVNTWTRIWTLWVHLHVDFFNKYTASPFYLWFCTCGFNRSWMKNSFFDHGWDRRPIVCVVLMPFYKGTWAYLNVGTTGVLETIPCRCPGMPVVTISLGEVKSYIWNFDWGVGVRGDGVGATDPHIVQGSTVYVIVHMT